MDKKKIALSMVYGGACCIEELMRLIVNSPGFEDWDTDYSPNSLYELGAWFATNFKNDILL